MIEKIIEALHQLSPFDNWLIQLGVNEDIAEGVSLIVVIIVVLLVVVGCRYLHKKKSASKQAIKALENYLGYQKVHESQKLFVPTQVQDASPNRQDEIAHSTKYVNREPLIPWFFHTAFNVKVDQQKFYIILADSGIGRIP